jgi:hypothetical protein
VRTVLCHPREAVARQPVAAARKENGSGLKNVNGLKNAMKCVVRLHRKCKRERGKGQCVHLDRFLAKLRQLATGETSLKVVENETSQ